MDELSDVMTLDAARSAYSVVNDTGDIITHERKQNGAERLTIRIKGIKQDGLADTQKKHGKN